MLARWVVVALLVLIGGFMIFDGARALVVGDYLTPSSGPHAGRLGPWSGLVEAVGVGPRSTPMKVTFVVIGLAHVIAAAGFAFTTVSGWLVIAAAVLGLWYLPFGTVGDLAVILLVATTSLRPWN